MSLEGGRLPEALPARKHALCAHVPGVAHDPKRKRVVF